MQFAIDVQHSISHAIIEQLASIWPVYWCHLANSMFVVLLHVFRYCFISINTVGSCAKRGGFQVDGGLQVDGGFQVHGVIHVDSERTRWKHQNKASQDSRP